MSRGTVIKRLYFEFDNGLISEAKFIYRCRDPYAVTFEFPDCRDGSHTWVFARDLLSDGVESSVDVGDGDVLVSSEGDEVRLTLCSQKGTRVTLLFDLTEVITALEETYAAIPRGGEYVDFGKELARLVADHG